MSSLGSYLRDLRQRRGQSLDEVSRATRVATRYLEALEADDFAELPPSVFTRGYLRAYCQVLGESPDEALLLYRRQTGAPDELPVRAAAAGALDGPGRARGTVLVSFILLVVLGLALFAVTLALQSGRDNSDVPRADSRPLDVAAPLPPEASVEPEASERSPVPPPAAVPGATASPPAAAAPAPAPESAAPRPGPITAPSANEIHAAIGAVASPYQLVARMSEPTWIRVRMEDGRATEETVAAGETRVWMSRTPFVLTIGNAGGVALELNGRRLPPLGARGAVIARLILPPSGP
jgi:cytoskeleton protein RodZ